MLEDSPVTDFLILPGYHLYRMNYQEILHFHQQTTADITISALISEQTNDKGFGILTVNSDNQVLKLYEQQTTFPLVSFLNNYLIIE